ncbi:CheY-like chemotaxis protein [Wenyingzhuangia heitensis]|uniref:CheY-like chemotaxis protein n=1 Tax=Wenyingzhuangia heitensis TaxID=1487859 RepID=A0ABX0UAR7_9FLAO|nr:response regulator [Wenyingzhuangia heitensis]NIJ45459.1 CheY-like chemotaxis protein [Wenyingzhuangia heitensis]
MKKKVLYVEDNFVNRLLLEKSLHGIVKIDTEENGFKGIALAEEKKYDVYILDLNLGDPEIDGFGVLQSIKVNKQLKGLYVALTAYDGTEWKNKCIDSGFDMYFTKPVNAKSMWLDIENYLKIGH